MWTCRYNARLKEIELNSDDSVKCFKMADGTTVEGDLYVSAMPGLYPQFLSCASWWLSQSLFMHVQK